MRGAMIISASRRTDIPAYHADWFMERVRAGACRVPNPVNPARFTDVSLRPDDVDAIVFWTRNAGPLLKHLDELDARGFRYYFHYTLMDNPPELDPGVPRLEAAAATFRALAGRVGPRRVIWRYDPVVVANRTPPDFHRAAFEAIAAALEGATLRCVISLADLYRGAEARLRRVPGLDLMRPEECARAFRRLGPELARMAAARGMELVTCAEEAGAAGPGVKPGRCIDHELIRDVFGIAVTARKDPSQRKACRCVVSRDIGVYGTCPAGCVYCYAARDRGRAADTGPRQAGGGSP
ncbi:MAG: DUF1848 domain-containing protein [Lentisphaerae bacterium]|nr:DUF1848 domain-containing protein [Lentisphaerota bacterium]